MSRKNVISSHKKQTAPMKAAKAVMLLMSLYFSCAMPILTGAGLIHNRSSYGEKLAETGAFFIFSAILMTLGAFLCLFRQKVMNILSLFTSVGGLVLCMVMLKRLTDHADASGWADKYSLEPISAMYDSRILPCIAPVAVAAVIAVVQLLSCDD